MSMRWMIGFVGMTVGGYIGWWIGAQVGFMTAFFLSMVFTGVGLWVGRRLAAEYLE